MATDAAVDVALLERLVRVETKLDMALSGMTKDLTDHENTTEKKLEEHDSRIRALEKWAWKAAGAAAAIAGLVGSAVGAIISNAFGG